VTLERRRHQLRLLIPQARRTLDVGEQERHRAGRQHRHRDDGTHAVRAVHATRASGAPFTDTGSSPAARPSRGFTRLASGAQQVDRVHGAQRQPLPVAWHAEEVVRQIYTHPDPRLAAEWIDAIGRDFTDAEGTAA
jgi:hypothetical protein